MTNPEQETLLSRDPVCGMDVDPSHAAGQSTFQGRVYLFCSARCLDRFDANPRAYPSAAHSAPRTPTRAPGMYTCPMHPDIQASGPGPCPTCGMALEPFAAVADEANPELRAMTRRFRISAVLTMPVFLTAMADMWPGQPLAHAAPRALIGIQWLLATPVVWWGG